MINDSIRYLISDDSNYEYSYSGIGGVDTPIEICALFNKVAMRLSQKGCVLRSGGDLGGDAAFESGALFKEIYLPYPNYNSNKSQRSAVSKKSIEIARENHPAWHRCSEFAKKYHSRSVNIVLGEDLQSPAKFLLCWSPDGVVRREMISSKTGLARVAISLAMKHEIPILNAGNSSHADLLRKILNIESGDVNNARSGLGPGGDAIPGIPKKRGFSNVKR